MRKCVGMAAALVAATVMAASTIEKAPAFEKVPAQAKKMLKGAVGKPVETGLVFANGQYIRPPYRVARIGTAIYINDIQVTDQIQPWRKFLATQPGYTGNVPAKANDNGGEAKSLDDLFADDEPEQAKGGSAVEEPFSPNAKSAALLREIDEYRTDVQRKLRAGNICFFGSRYARVIVEPRLAKGLLAALPEAMRDAEDGVDLETRVRAKGFVFLNRTLCMDLVDHRPDYLKLIDRRKHLQELERLEEIEKRNAQERGR